jgi:hypothetical protein
MAMVQWDFLFIYLFILLKLLDEERYVCGSILMKKPVAFLPSFVKPLLLVP